MTKIERAAYMRAWNKSEAGIASRIRRRKAHADYMREWNAAHADKRRATNRNSRSRNLSKAHEYRRTYYSVHGHKDRARKAVFTAVADGSLIRPDRCSDCGKVCKPDGHHHLGYERENWLAVHWLCRVCHRKADAKGMTHETDS